MYCCYLTGKFPHLSNYLISSKKCVCKYLAWIPWNFKKFFNALGRSGLKHLPLKEGPRNREGPNSGLADNLPRSRCSSHRESKGPLSGFLPKSYRKILETAKINETFYSISSRVGNSEFETVQVLLLGRERFYWETTKHISAELISETSIYLKI